MSRLKHHSFEKNLKEGNKAEEKLKELFTNVFDPILKHIIFEINPEKQRRGIDFEISSKCLSFDVKCRKNNAYRWKDLLLETISVVESNILGWLYASESDVIVYLWMNKQRTKFIDGYLIDLKKTRAWINHISSHYETIQNTEYFITKDGTRYHVKYAKSYNRPGNTWKTQNIAIPITDFVEGCIQKIPLLDLEPQQQTTLGEFFEPPSNNITEKSRNYKLSDFGN